MNVKNEKKKERKIHNVTLKAKQASYFVINFNSFTNYLINMTFISVKKTPFRYHNLVKLDVN